MINRVLQITQIKLIAYNCRLDIKMLTISNSHLHSHSFHMNFEYDQDFCGSSDQQNQPSSNAVPIYPIYHANSPKPAVEDVMEIRSTKPSYSSNLYRRRRGRTEGPKILNNINLRIQPGLPPIVNKFKTTMRNTNASKGIRQKGSGLNQHQRQTELDQDYLKAIDLCTEENEMQKRSRDKLSAIHDINNYGEFNGYLEFNGEAEPNRQSEFNTQYHNYKDYTLNQPQSPELQYLRPQSHQSPEFGHLASPAPPTKKPQSKMIQELPEQYNQHSQHNYDVFQPYQLDPNQEELKRTINYLRKKFPKLDVAQLIQTLYSRIVIQDRPAQYYLDTYSQTKADRELIKLYLSDKKVSETCCILQSIHSYTQSPHSHIDLMTVDAIRTRLSQLLRESMLKLNRHAVEWEQGEVLREEQMNIIIESQATWGLECRLLVAKYYLMSQPKYKEFEELKMKVLWHLQSRSKYG